METTNRTKLLRKAAQPHPATARPSSVALAVSAALLPWGYAHALPTGEQVVAGQVTVARPSSQSMQINQATQ